MAIETGGLKTAIATMISGGNSTSIPLNSGFSFSGAWEVTDNFTTLICSLKTDQTSTLLLEFSPDGVNIDSSVTYVVDASVYETHRIAINQRYFRARLFNVSVTNQTYLRMQVIYGNHSLQLSPLNSTIAIDADSLLTRSVMYGLDSTGKPVSIDGVSSLLANIKYDDIQVTYPTSTTENYAYYLATVLVATIEVTYSTSTKDVLTRARRI